MLLDALTLGLGLPVIFAVKTASDPSTSFEFLGFCVICGGATGPKVRSTVVEICVSDSPTNRRVIDSRNSVSRNSLYSKVSTCTFEQFKTLFPQRTQSDLRIIMYLKVLDARTIHVASLVYRLLMASLLEDLTSSLHLLFA